MVAMPKDAVSQRNNPVRAVAVRVLWLWLAGVLGIVILYLVFANVMMPTLQENMATTQIFAYRGWQSTGVRLQANETAVIRAKGQWLYTPGEWHDARGHKRYPAPSFYPMTGVAGGILIGRVGEDGYIQPIGTNGSIWSDKAGMLYLRINDDILSDNEGSLQVTVEVIPAPETDEN